ncbi:MAG TPA: amidase, partial [Ktedonobacteraceae bacterium]|nr:amidase [Ktedonobacteraceae bacterium]
MPYQSIQQAADDIRSGLVTPGELVEECFERIDQLDGEIKAFVTVMREEALRDAEQAEREQRTGFHRGPLHGIPIGVKDIIAVKGVRLTAGSRVLAKNIAAEDAAVVEQLRRAGAIILGKTNTHEFAYGTYTPPTRNPWDTSRIPGGSSGGSAAA